MDTDSYVRVRNNILRLINSKEFVREFGNGSLIKNAVNVMIQSLDNVAKGGRSGVGPNMMSAVMNGNRAVMEFVIYKRLSRFSSNFVMVYADLLTMFNKELAYNFDFDIMADAIRAIVKSYLTLMESIDVMRNLLERAERYLRMEPPAYSMSRHFLEKIWNKLETEGEVGDYPNKAVVSCKSGDNCKQGDSKS